MQKKLQKWNFVAHEILVGKWTNEAKMWGLLSKAGQWEVAMLYRHLIGEILWSISQWLGLHIVHSVQKLKQQRVVTWYTQKKITNSQTVRGNTQINSKTLVAMSNVHQTSCYILQKLHVELNAIWTMKVSKTLIFKTKVRVKYSRSHEPNFDKVKPLLNAKYQFMDLLSAGGVLIITTSLETL